MTTPNPIRVLCVEDNQLVADAIGRKLTGDPGFDWLGWVSNIQDLLAKARSDAPHVVCMDLDVPGQDTLEMIRQLRIHVPDARVLILTGHVRAEYINQAVDAGAWGYLSKAEESRTIVDSIRRVASGNFVLGKLTQAEAKVPVAPAPPAAVEPKIGADPTPAPVVRWNLRNIFRREKARSEPGPGPGSPPAA